MNQPRAAQRREDFIVLMCNVVLRLDGVCHSQVKAEARNANSFGILIHPHKIVFENGTEIADERRLFGMRAPPTIDESLEGLDQKNSRAATGIKDTDVPIVAVPREHRV